jgi:hypothetical protein
MAVADRLGGDEPLVGVSGWHADVCEHDVGQPRIDEPKQALGVARFADHVKAGLGQQPREPFAQQTLVFGQDDAHGGIVPCPGRTLVSGGAAPETMALCPTGY